MPAAIVGGAIGGIGSIAGGLIAKGQASGAEDQALAATQKAIDEINKVGAPPDLSRQIFLDQFKQAGILSPEMEQEINVQFDKIAPVSRDVVNAQTDALNKLRGISKQGLTAEDRLALNQMQTQTARQNTAQQNAIIQNMAARGQAGGGAELAARLQAAQGNANQANEGGLQIAAQAAQRALQAIGQQGNLASTMRGQEFGENSANANIQNEQNRFNTQNQLAMQQRNVGASNQAQQYNLGNAQNISNANVQMGNAERLRQNQAQEQNYQDRMAQAQGKANALVGQGQQIAKYGENNAASTAGMFGGLANIATGIGQGIQNQNNYDALLSKMGSSNYASPGSYNVQMPSLSGPLYGGNTSGYADGGYVTSNYGSPNPNDPQDLYCNGGTVNMQSGGHVPGQPLVPGDSPVNDTTDAKLSPGEYVLPNSVTHNAKIMKKIMDILHDDGSK